MSWKMVRSRLPSWKDIWPVYALIVFLLYTWSLFLFFWEFPSWSKFMTVGELFTIFCYVMSLCLFESMTFLAALLGICAALPVKMLKEYFIVRGSYFSFFILAGIMLYWYIIFPGNMFISSVIIFVVAIFFSFIAVKVGIMYRTAMEVTERLTIFLYLYLPVSVVLLVVVLIRNLFFN